MVQTVYRSRDDTRETHQTLAMYAPEPRRSTLDPDRGYYGEAPARLRWGYGGVSGRLGTLSRV
jgi:hypothetical protein